MGEEDYSQYLREDLEDAHLSSLGATQCSDVGEKSLHQTAELLVVSPMRRTLQTASQCFPHLVGSIPWIALESVREVTGLHPCDRRMPISYHAENHSHIDFSGIEHENDPMYHMYDTREPDDHVEKRATDFLLWLHSREENEIVVVTHSAFLRVLFQRILHPGNDHEKFENCEIRTVTIEPNHEGIGGWITKQ